MTIEELKQLYAQDAEIYEQPWLLWEFKHTKYPWHDCTFEPAWYPQLQYRRKQQEK